MLDAAFDDRVLARGSLGSLRRESRMRAMARGHRHRELETNLVLAGRAAYVMGGRRVDLARGSLLWLFPGQDHMLVDATPDLSFWLGVFSPDLVAQECADGPAVLLQDDPPGSFCRVVEDPAPLAAAFEAVAAARAPAARRSGLAWAIHAAWEAFEAAPERGATGLHPSVALAVAALGEEGAEWTLDTLALLVGLSPAYLSALFKREVGVGLGDFRNRLRLGRYLRHRASLGVEAAALEAGFGSYAAFHRTFRRAFGCAPGDYPPT